MRYILLLILVAFAGVTPASIEVSPTIVYQINSANITFSSTQYFDDLNLGSNYITLNTSTIYLTPSTQIGVTINSYDTTGDVYNITFAGTGTVDILQKTSKANTLYNTFLGGVYVYGIQSNTTGWIDKKGIPVPGTYTWPVAYTLPPAGGETPPPQGGDVPPRPPATPSVTPANATIPGIAEFNGSKVKEFVNRIASTISSAVMTPNIKFISRSALVLLSLIVGSVFVTAGLTTRNGRVLRFKASFAVVVGLALIAWGMYLR